MKRQVIAVDLDGTLAYQDQDMVDEDCVGHPVPAMLKRVKDWVDEGKEVWIFTARLSHGDTSRKTQVIQDWLEEQGLPRLHVTAEKSNRIVEYWDDRAREVITNTGHAPLHPES